jgi:glucose 1-dehydrogenase
MSVSKVAIVTGAATGIGREIALHLSRAKIAVAVNFVDKPDKANEVVNQIEKDGGHAVAIAGDVSVKSDVDHLVAETVRAFGRLDILVNNAGIEHEMPFLETPLEVWDRVIAVNLTGPWLCIQAAAKQMAAQGIGGRIINISSVHEDLAMPKNSPYCASKGGLRMLMRTLAVELAHHQITVNNIGPGAIDTPLDAPVKADPKKMETLLAEIPLRRMGRPEEIAALAVFLSSDSASYITGSTYFMDGGMLRHSGSL